jgi:hypothetical protein
MADPLLPRRWDPDGSVPKNTWASTSTSPLWGVGIGSIVDGTQRSADVPIPRAHSLARRCRSDRHGSGKGRVRGGARCIIAPRVGEVAPATTSALCSTWDMGQYSCARPGDPWARCLRVEGSPDAIQSGAIKGRGRDGPEIRWVFRAGVRWFVCVRADWTAGNTPSINRAAMQMVHRCTVGSCASFYLSRRSIRLHEHRHRVAAQRPASLPCPLRRRQTFRTGVGT